MSRGRPSRPEAKPIRLFVAFEVPDEAQRAIDGAVAPLRERFPKARWVPTENRHVTLKFLGRTWPRLRAWVEERVSDVAAASAPIETRLTSVGTFPGGSRARVLWAGLADPEERVARIAGALDDALAAEFRPETRAFAPHCTVARSDPPLLLEPGDLDAPLEPVAFAIERIVLFRSHLQRPAPRYEPLLVATLGSAEVIELEHPFE